MSERRVLFSNIVKNQLPQYVREEFPLVEEFLSQYYRAQEFQGAPVDLIQNIDSYVKLDSVTNQIDSANLAEDIGYTDDVIYIDTLDNQSIMAGFPDSYGLIKIDDEIITYTGKTTNSFTGCLRGFSGITNYKSDNNPEELVFSSSLSNEHTAGATVTNLSSLFLFEFLKKTKVQLAPGFEDRTLAENLNQNIFIKQVKDFYRSKGTDESFKILFLALYGENAKIIHPKEFLVRSSDAQYRITKDFVVESVSGDPLELVNSTIYQDEYGDIPAARAPVTHVEKIVSDTGRNYYKLSIDGGYNRDIGSEGPSYGDFKVHPKTRLIGQLTSTTAAITIDVDSTIGFPQSGELYVTYDDLTTGTISYTSKSLTQFFGCTNILGTVLDGTELGLNTVLYGRAFDGDETITVRVRSVLNSLDVIGDTSNLKTGDEILIKTLGINSTDTFSEKWSYNTCPTYKIDQISLINNATWTYEITTKEENIFKINDSVTLLLTNGAKFLSRVVEVNSPNTFKIRDQGELDTNLISKIKRNILRASATKYSNVSSVSSDIQNLYKDKENTKVLVASSSLPNYGNLSLDPYNYSVLFSGPFSGDTFAITSSVDHGFYTGDAVYYTPQIIPVVTTDDEGNTRTEFVISSSLCDEGLYFVKRVDSNNIKLAKSKSDIDNSIFVTLSEETNVTDNRIELYKFHNKSLNNQKLLREISTPINDGNVYETSPGSKVGILVNGVEILNYKSLDRVYYGKIENIDVVSEGTGYDIINPPLLNISDSVGTGATGHCSVNGTLSEIRVINTGFDYVEEPIINISGGNGIGAIAKAKMKLIDHEVSFNSNASAQLVNLTTDVIGFSTYHKFRNGEQVIYVTSGQRAVAGLVTNSDYYVSTLNSTTISLHKNFSDALSGINTIQITGYGEGRHSFRTVNKKLVVGGIQVVSVGTGYENKKRVILDNTTGISTSLDYIEIQNHGYKSGEKIVYSTTGTSIGGISTTTSYYVTRVDDNKFRLSNVGTGDTTSDFYYQTKQYVDITSTGSGVHSFNYPDITVEVTGRIGISSIGSETFQATVQPIFRGKITTIQLTNNGSAYGSDDTLNYLREPSVSLSSGSNCQLTPIIAGNRIVEVIVNNSGNGYNSPPTIEITGNGSGAILTPIINNGQVTEVKVIESGYGYSQASTSLTVLSSGSGVKFSSKIQTWNVNNFVKYFNKISADDGIISPALNESSELQFTHLYAPRKLREILYSSDQDGNKLYGNNLDLRRPFNVEIDNTDHSPIIGWAYDGNPIYGPYGYVGVNKNIVQMKSGYVLDLKTNRPSLSYFPEGFFVEDYSYKKVSDEAVLDENNGRFCITPEYPSGTYAYFATLQTFTDSSGPFQYYKRPVFPYLVGDCFYSIPNSFNFKKLSNQDNIDLNQTDWIRNTNPLNLGLYEYITLPNNLRQKSLIKFASPGSISDLTVKYGGSGYAVGDSLQFSTPNTSIIDAIAFVSKVDGVGVSSVSVATTSISSVKIEPIESPGIFNVLADSPHNLTNSQTVTISGLSSTSTRLEGQYLVGVSTNTLSLKSGVGTVGSTGIVTYFSVAGNISPDKIRENDIYTVGSERVKILNVDTLSSRIRVLRGVNGTVSSAHTATSVLYELPRKLTINSGVKTSYSFRQNREIYFNPIESVGLGTLTGVGIGSTLAFSNPGVGVTQLFVPTRSIYLPQHNILTGDTLTYYTNGGSPLVVSRNGISTFTLSNSSTVYAAKIDDNLIGIATVRVGLGSTGNFVGVGSASQSILYFVGVGTGNYHSFVTNYPVITGNVSKNTVTVSTAQSHGLLNNDTVYVDVNPSVASTFVVKYNDYNRKLLINPQSFTSSDVSTLSNSVTIVNHGYTKGQKVLHTSSSPGIGLSNNNIYYVVPVDENTFKLSDSYYQTQLLNPQIVGISSAANGTFSAINPPISAYKDSTIVFDLSDSSLSYTKGSTLYPAFKFELYRDSNFTQKFYATSSILSSSGAVGISSGARVLLSVDSTLPEKLFYNLTPIFESDTPVEKQEINVDDFVDNNNQIIVKDSGYNGTHTIVSTSNTSFTYILSEKPEKTSYIAGISSIVYTTSSTNVSGPIADIRLINGGKNYYSLPAIQSVGIGTTPGIDAVIDINTNDIGKLKSYRINDIGFDLPSDFTLRPSASLPQVIKIKSLSSFDSIGITSSGRGYNVSPKLVVLDGQTNQVITDVDLKYSPGSNSVEILKNTFSLTNSIPTIIPTQNPNGVGISSISYDDNSGNVTVTLAVGFGTVNSFPFAVGDRVLVENINLVSTSSTTKGYNSSDYNYQLFTINNIDPNIGGIGATVSYNLSQFLQTGESAGVFKPSTSSGRIIPEKYFPIFDIVLKKGQFLNGEPIESASATGVVNGWDDNNNYLRVSSKQDFVRDETVKGLTSNTVGVVQEVDNVLSYFDLDSYSIVEKGWLSNAGFLNDNQQKIQDSLYYQNFSYSIKSRVSYDDWNDAVSSLNHTSGFKKFSDLQVESKLPLLPPKNLKVSVPNDSSTVNIVNDLNGFVSLNCFYDFDLVRENSLQVGGLVFSDEILFSNRILTDYYESVGNRVLLIDDISSQFNSYPRPSRYVEAFRFSLNSTRAQKFFTYVIDKTFIGQRQFLIVSSIHDGSNFYVNQYGRVESTYDLGSFDFIVDGTDGVMLFYPTRSSVNNYDVINLCYNIRDGLSGIGSTSFGGIVDFTTNNVVVSAGTTTTIVSVGNTYTSLKVLTEITTSDNEYEFNEITVISDGTNVDMIDYGQLTTSSSSYSSNGIGTYYPYIQGSNIKVDFIPNPGIAATITTINVAIANTNYSGIGTITLQHAKLEARSTSIASTTSPTAVVIGQFADDEYDSAYFVAQVSDLTNNRYQVSEILLLDDETQTYTVEFASIDTGGSIGTFGSQRTGTTTQLLFTPPSSTQTEVKIYMNSLRHQDNETGDVVINFEDATVSTDHAIYYGADIDVKREFELTHKSSPIFQKQFDGSSSSVVDITENTITLPSHFFVTGEKIIYGGAGAGSTQAIGIASTYFGVGIGTTDKLPSELYVVKIKEDKIRLARSAQDALLSVPNVLNLTSVGIGSTHTFTAINKNAKVIVSIDNVIQSPVVAGIVTSSLAGSVAIVDNELFFTGITSFFGGDLFKVDDEIMRIEAVGVGSANAVRVVRPWLGTTIATHSIGSTVTKVTGDYNIVNNNINFVTAPYGNVPLSTTSNPPNERDWTGISTSSSFHGRVFLRSGTTNSSNETYHKNYVFDDISNQFDGIENTFTLKSGGVDVGQISAENAVVLINDIFQGPGVSQDYYLAESAGITSAIFTGSGTTISADPNASNLPLGGIIVSVASTEGFGYQPLISAGGTVTVSGGGTIQSITIGNTGSGYRASGSYEILTSTSSTISVGSTSLFLQNNNSVFGILNTLNTGANCTIGIGTFIGIGSVITSVGSTFVTVGTGATSSYSIPSGTPVSVKINNPQIGIVNVGIASTSVSIHNVTHVGFATIVDGHISTSVSITKVSSGHTSTNPPYVVIDAPLSYTNIPLVYSPQYTAGIGTQATIDIVVGQGSSVIDFTIKELGYAYRETDVLTVPVGGATGIPTTSSANFAEFQLTVQKIISDKFAGWSIGQLEVLDSLDSLFDGNRVVFPLSLSDNPISIRSARGSNVTVQDTLLVFINDVLQVPGNSYVFTGGSVIRFTEAPKSGDRSRIIFYKGSGDIDVAFKDIIETIKIGDELTIEYDSSIGQSPTLKENPRVVDSILAIDAVSTNPYFGPGNVEDNNLLRPVTFCKQTEDKIINEQQIGKDRDLYEPQVYPSSYLIQPVGVGSTTLHVDNIRPFFNPSNESQTSLSFQDKIRIISQDIKVGAIATSMVSTGGTVTSISISNGGSGYISAPTVIFESPVGLGTTQRATGIASITSGIVTSITITYGGVGYATSTPPQVLIEPPTSTSETNPVSSYSGDSGVIVGFGISDAANTKLIFDFHIPQNSYLRNANIVGTALTLSPISVGDYFAIKESNISLGVSTITSLDIYNNVIGIGTEYLDNVYQVDSVAIVSVANTSIGISTIGTGTTIVKRVYARVSGISTIDFSNNNVTFDSTTLTFDLTTFAAYGYVAGITTSSSFGNYSWGKIQLASRSELNTFNSYNQNGVTGIVTSGYVIRNAPLKYSRYIS